MENYGFSPVADCKSNVFLIDWLTVTSHCDTVESLKAKLGFVDSGIPWEDSVKFINGYPCECKWNGVSFWYGADNAEYYKDTPGGKTAKEKVRTDMGICLNLSGAGCRTYESYGLSDWFGLLQMFFSGEDYNITRIDLAYDDHIGILDIHRIRLDTEDESFTSKSKKWQIELSGDQETGIRGCSCYFGRKASEIMVRIYDKAAERGFNDRHWVRVELQLRGERAAVAAAEFIKREHIGETVAGILKNYLQFRVPSGDTNKSRWPVAEYWQQVIGDMEKISLWISPGEEYNFMKTQQHLLDQWGQVLLVTKKIGELGHLIDNAERCHRELAPKYQRIVDEYEYHKALTRGDTSKLEQDSLF